MMERDKLKRINILPFEHQYINLTEYATVQVIAQRSNVEPLSPDFTNNVQRLKIHLKCKNKSDHVLLNAWL